MKNLLVLVLLFVSYIPLQAQKEKEKDEEEENTYIESPVDEGNLVNNGDFENYEGRLTKSGRFYLVSSWGVLTGSRADFYEKGNELTYIGIPDNDYGFQESFSMDHYAGINAFSYDPKNYRSYLYTELKSKLEKDQLYCVKYLVNLADRSRFAIANLSVYFSNSDDSMLEKEDVYFDAQIKNESRKVLKNTHKWESVCNVLTATGKEKYLVIGNFDSNSETIKEKVIAPESLELDQVQMAYYYIDYVSVKPIDRFSDCKCSVGKERGPDIVFSKSVGIDDDASNDEVVESSTIYFGFLKKNINSSGKADLDRLAKVMEENPILRMKITGHTDTEEAGELGDDVASKDYSRERAYQALDYLAKKGIKKSRFDVYGDGATSPASSGKTPLSKAKNRRIEFKLID